MENKTNGVLLATEAETGALTQSDIATLAKAGVIPANTPFDQVMVFARICRERGLSPFSKEIYLVQYAGRYSVVVGIGGFRRLANDTGCYAGCDDAKFDLKSDGTWKTAAELIEAKQLPATCSMTVYRVIANLRVAFSHTAVFREFSTGQNKWQTMPFQMIAKVAESFALRKGFSDRLNGLSIEEEQGAIEDAQPSFLSTKPGESMEQMLVQIKQRLSEYTTTVDLLKYYEANPQWRSNGEITQLFTDRKNDIEDASGS